ncbi:MAG: hypothetical protein AAF620_12805 [Bacteroidota bacterium]
MKNIKIYWREILRYGSILSVLFTAVVLISYLIEPLIWANDFPPEVQEKIGEVPAETIQKAVIVLVVILTLMIVLPVLLSRTIIKTNQSQGSFLNLLVNSFLLLNFMNLFDALVVDILIFGMIQPDFMWIEGAEDYIREYVTPAFHFIGFLKGQPYMVVTALLAAGISVLLKGRFSKAKTLLNE